MQTATLYFSSQPWGDINSAALSLKLHRLPPPLQFTSYTNYISLKISAEMAPYFYEGEEI